MKIEQSMGCSSFVKGLREEHRNEYMNAGSISFLFSSVDRLNCIQRIVSI